MKYKYTSFNPPEKNLKWLKRPMVSLEVLGPEESMCFDALIDSGADCSMFNYEIAKVLKLDLSEAKEVKFAGISGHIDGFRLEKVKIKMDCSQTG